MYYGSPFYIASILLAVGLLVGAYFLLKGRSEKTQKAVIIILMSLNVFQHVFKFLIYPQYAGEGFSVLNTAYNMCAALILLSPIAYLTGNRFLRDFTFYIGTIAGIIAIAVPYWFIGLEVGELGWEYVRFYVCHAMLFLSSALVLLLGHHRATYKRSFAVGLSFVLTLCLILLNDLTVLKLGLFPGYDSTDVYAALRAINPFWSMGPPTDGTFSWLVGAVEALSPSFLCGGNSKGLYVPILWYALPLYVGISLVSLAVFAIIDRRSFLLDLSYIRGKIKEKKSSKKR